MSLISKIKVDKKKLISNFKDIRNIGNFKILKCYHLLFKKDNIFKNIANFMLLILLIISISAIFTYIFHNHPKNKELIEQLTKQYDKNKEIDIRLKNKKEESKPKKDNNEKIKKIKKRKAKNKNNESNRNIKKKKSKINHRSSFNINFNQINLNDKNDINTVNKINKKVNNNETNKKDFKTKGKRNTKKFNTTKNKIITDKSNFNLNRKEFNYNEKNLKVEQDFNSFNINEINSLNYEEAKVIDKRSYWQYYLSLIKVKLILIFTYCYIRDYNSQIIKIYIFFYIFVINCTVSAMFYSDDTIHKIYEDKGSFDFTYQLPQMFYSLIISSQLKLPLNFLGLYENNILEIKNKNNNEKVNQKNNKNIMRCIKYKVLSFFIITYIFLFFIWFYLGCFCAVYKNTQIHLLKDVSISFTLSFITPFFKCLLPGLFRIPSLKSKKERIYMYNFSKLLQML